MGSLFGGKTKVTQATDPIAQAAFDQYKNALGPIQNYLGGQIQNFMQQPTYGGQTYAGLDPMNQAYYDQAGSLANNVLGQVQNTMGGAANNYDATKDYGTRIAAFGNLLQNPNGGFNMGNALANSPMAQNMIDASSRDITRNLGTNLANLDVARRAWWHVGR